MIFTDVMAAAPGRVSLAVLPTPLRSLDRISEQLGGPRIWLKQDDLSGCLLSGNKVRKLEYVIGEALAEGCDTLITCGGTQSNHCRATALAGAQLGLDVHLILRDDGDVSAQIDGNLLLDHLTCANVSVYSAEQYGQQLPELFSLWQEHYRALGKTSRMIPVGASDATGLWGYIQAAQELHEDFRRVGIQPKTVVCASGSGGTQAGLSLGFHLLKAETSVCAIAVCDSSSYFAQKVHADICSWEDKYLSKTPYLADQVKIETLDDYIGPGYAKGYPALFDTIKHLARLEGVVLDPVYTGKAFHGLKSEIQKGTFDGHSDIVFVHTGGIFGLFPHRQALL